MSPKTNDQFENIRKERKQLILDSALLVFSKKGYHAASIANIASEANISKGLIYNYFNSKEEILAETLTTGLDYIFKHFRFDPETLTPEGFTKLLELTFDLLEDDFSYWKIYFSVLLQPDVTELVLEKIMESILPAINDLANYFARLGYSNPLEEARFLGAMLDGLSINYITDTENFPKEYCINRLKSIYNLP